MNICVSHIAQRQATIGGFAPEASPPPPPPVASDSEDEDDDDADDDDASNDDMEMLALPMRCLLDALPMRCLLDTLPFVTRDQKGE